MKNQNKEIKEVKKVVAKDLDKNSRIFLFLNEITADMSSKDIENIYNDKYNLSQKSKRFNIRVIKRFFGNYEKYSAEKKAEIKNKLVQDLKVLKIDYQEFIKKEILLKDKFKRSNRVTEKRELNFKEIEKLI